MRRYALAGIGVILLVLILGPMPGVAAGSFEVALVKITSPVRTGDIITVTVRAVARAECKGQVRFKLVTTPMSSKPAGDDGTVSWSWRLANTRAPGKWPVEVQCTQGDKKGFLTTQIDVQG